MDYILIYHFYALFMILGGVIWLKDGYGRVHHYQVGFVVLISAIPLAIFIVFTQDILGLHLLVDVLILGISGIVLDYKDVFYALRLRRIKK